MADDTVVSVLDLPQIYQRPNAESILNALETLRSDPSSFSEVPAQQPLANQEDTGSYLTRIIASPLAWIEDESKRELIWEITSQRLSERSGRSAMGAMTRSFVIPTNENHVELQIHEPALTGDNLGLKTWGSSFVLAKQLHLIKLPTQHEAGELEEIPHIMELGAGTGLVGLAAACVFHTRVMLTDLCEIVPNLNSNIETNETLLEKYGGSAYCGELDWRHAKDLRRVEDKKTIVKCIRPGDVRIIIASDPVYMSEHPRLLVDTILTWLCKMSEARVIIAYPLREAYAEQIMDLRNRLREGKLKVEDEGEISGRDDWTEEVQHSWSVWKWIWA